MLFHVSESPDITRFEPRDSPPSTDPVVWAIDEEHLRNYLLPRECPRVAFCAVDSTTAADRAEFLRGAQAVVAIEEGWLERVQSTPLYCYHFPSDAFVCRDAGAGYFVSGTTVVPVRVDVLARPLETFTASGAELLVLPNLWSLHDAVAASSLQFSMIRMRNALPRIADNSISRSGV